MKPIYLERYWLVVIAMAAGENPRRCRGRKGERALSEIPEHGQKGTSLSCPEPENMQSHILTPSQKNFAVSQINNRHHQEVRPIFS